MRVTKNYTIDYEFTLLLDKEPNASGLINKLLDEHYSSKNKQNSTKIKALLDEKNVELKKIRKEARQLLKDFNLARDRENKSVTLVKGYPKNVINTVLQIGFEKNISHWMKHEALKDYSQAAITKLWRELKGGSN